MTVEPDTGSATEEYIGAGAFKLLVGKQRNRVIFTKNGRPAAILINVDEYTCTEDRLVDTPSSRNIRSTLYKVYWRITPTKAAEQPC